MTNTATANPQTTLSLIEKLLQLPMENQAQVLYYITGMEAAQIVAEAKAAQ